LDSCNVSSEREFRTSNTRSGSWESQGQPSLRSESLLDPQGPKSKKDGWKVRVDFSKVIQSLKEKGSAAGFQQLRDFLLENYKDLKSDMGAGNIVTLAINCDKHSMFARIAEGKAQTKKDQQDLLDFQKYLQGSTSLDDLFKNVQLENPQGVEEESEDGEDEPDDA
jgi:hypothetical protein